MPRVLVVTYQWLPCFNANVKHVANLCRYLPGTGWEPHILTKDWSEGPAPEDACWGMTEQSIDASPSLKHAAALPIVHAHYAPRDNRWLRRQARLEGGEEALGGFGARSIVRSALRSAYPLFGHYPDMHRGWVEPAVAAGLVAVRQHGIGAVLSVCPPASSHLVGGEIARRAGIPWLAMFSDLSTFYQGASAGRTWRERWASRILNRRWMKGATRSACISPRMVEYVREAYAVNGDVVVVPFDPGERRVAPHRVPGAPLRVVHAGPIHPQEERTDVLFDALDQLVASGVVDANAMTVELVGSECDEWLVDQVRNRPCEAMVRVVGRVSPAETTRMQREADVLLLLDRPDTMTLAPGRALTYPSRIFEQLNAARPTIAVASNPVGYVGTLLSETNAGQTAEDAQSLSAVLFDYVNEVRSRGHVAFRGNEPAIMRYGAREQAKRLALLLDAASAERFGTWQRA
ncbi:hypothetical protein BH09GEM1_BH09GEM1_04880 [soil metagenome]